MAEYQELVPGEAAYYDGMIMVDLSAIRPMIAMPFHPSNTYPIEEVNANLTDILHDVEKRAAVSLDGAVPYCLQDKVRDGKFCVDQGLSQAARAAGLKTSVRRRIFLRADILGQRALRSASTPRPCPFIWN